MADDLARAQSSLERALARARAGEDKVLMAQVRERGEQFTHLLTGLVRMSHIHATDNHVFDQPIGELHRALEQLRALVGAVHLVTVEDQTYLNDVRLKQPAAATGQKSLGAELRRHNVGALSFLGELSTQELRVLVALLAGRAAETQPRTALAQALRERNVPNVELQGVFQFKLHADDGARPNAAPAPGAEGKPIAPRDAHATAAQQSIAHRLARLVEETWENVATGQQLNLLGLRRLVVELQQLGPGSEGQWLQSPEGFSDHGWHSWRMVQLSLLVSEALGLPVGVQQDYGLAAALHDVGYAVPLPQASGLHTHGAAGVVALLKQPGFHEAKVRRLFATWLHHEELTVHGQRAPLVTRVLRVLDEYEALQRSRTAPCSPPDALGRLAGGAGPHYDPVVVQTLINCLGAYPPGTFLQLEDGRVVRSISGVRSPQTFAQPRALVVALPGRQPAPPNSFIDLAREGKVKDVLRPRPVA
ncbi:MAG: hypothetical protein U0228_03105 [Myxococcaceae bacterium]